MKNPINQGGSNMKAAAMVLTLSLAAAPATRAQASDHHRISPFKPQITYRDHIAIAVDHDDVMVYDKNDDDEQVEITGDNRLYVRDKLVRTDAGQQALTRDYHDRVIRIQREVRKIAADGARIGVDGAKIGLKAVVGVFKLILPDYSTEDLDRDMDRESEKIDAKAKRLEAKAAVVDSSVTELERLHYRMKMEIPELNELEWF
jgi:hypothetical protein